MTPAEHDVRSIVRGVFRTQLGFEISDGPADTVESPESTVTAAIHISGAFRGAVRLECDRRLVRRAAAVMFSQPESELTREDEVDVIGELTNVVAGNIKALLPGDNSISLPTIVDGSDYTVSTVDIRSSEDYRFFLDGMAMVVTVVEHQG